MDGETGPALVSRGPLSDVASAAQQERAPVARERRGRTRWVWAIALFWVLMALGAVLVGISLWVRRTFGVISIDQLISNLPGGGGEGAGGSELVVNAVVTAILIPLAIVLILLFLVEKSRRALREHGILRGSRATWLRAIATVLAVLVPLGGAALLGATIGLRDYVSALTREAATGTSLADYYANPLDSGGSIGQGELGAVASTGADDSAEMPNARVGTKRQNLILIYLESIEDSFSDDSLFEKNMLEPVQEATEGWEAIPSLQQYDGGGWTMSGIVSTQCGIPLRTAGSLSGPDELNDLGIGKPVVSYLPGATCLGDVLSAAGYRNVFLGGADASFAGKGAFLKTHGYDEVLDLPHWLELGETEVRDDWGLSDRRLFDHAKEEVSRLHAADEPFNLTMLSLDTHEGPRVYDYCDWNTETAMTSITFCSMQQVSEFVKYLGDEGVLEDTAVVLMGDHQKMIAQGGSFFDELNDRADRSIFNRVWAPGGASFAEPEIDQFSMYPTLLELVGIAVPDHRAGIGVSALAADNEIPAGTIRDLAADEYRDLVRSRSVDFYHELWSAQ